MKVEFKNNKDSSSDLQELNELISEAISLYSNTQGCTIESSYKVNKFERYEILILENLLKKTNLKKIYKKLNLSYNINFILCKLNKSSKEKNTDTLLKIINSYINSHMRKKDKKFYYYISLKLKYKLKEEEIKKLKRKLKSSLNIEILKVNNKIRKDKDKKFYNDIKIEKTLKKTTNTIKSNKFKILLIRREFIHRILLIQKEINEKELNGIIYTFLGIFCFSENYNRSTRMWRRDNNYAYFNEIDDNYFFILEDNNIVYPEEWNSYEAYIKKEDINPPQNIIMKINNEKTLKKIFLILDLIKKQNQVIKEFIYEIMNLYYQASIDKNLEISFLKYWIIVEKIIKKSESMNDEKLSKIVKKLFENKLEKKMIDIVYEKRNSLIHEFNINFIEQVDRNFMKLVAEEFILILVYPAIKFKNFKEFGDIMKILFDDKKKLIKNRNLINKLIKIKSKV